MTAPKRPPDRSRALGLAGCLAVAMLALGSGLDRMAAATPALARFVPAPLAAISLRATGRDSLATGNVVAAQRLGLAAVAAAPVDPESAALLGAARYAGGDRGGAERAFRVAGQLGWRVPYTQTYWMGRALAQGDYRVAALRLDALLRQQPALVDDQALLAPLETVPAGREALAGRMLAGPGWLDSYLGRVGDAPQAVLRRRAEVLVALARQGGTIGCRGIAQLVEQLVVREAVIEAAGLWRAHCPASRRALIYDGNFAAAQIDQTYSQFAWTFIGQSDVAVQFAPAAKAPERLLLIESTATVPRMVVRQLVLAGPGTYRIGWRAETEAGAPSALIAAAFDCTPDPRGWRQGRYDRAARRWNADVTVDGNCPARWLSFAVRGSGSARVEGISLARVR